MHRRSPKPSARARFRVSGFCPKPLLPARVCERNARDRHHFERGAPPLPCTTHHRRLRRQTRNQAIMAWFWVFGPQPPPPACVCERNVRGRYHFGSNTPPPPCTTHQPCLTQQARNQATVAWFRDTNYQRRPARASAGATHTGQHGPAQVRHKLRGGGERGRGAVAAQQLQQRRALPRPTFFVLFFYLANMSRLVVVPSPDLLTYFNVIKCNSNNFL